MNTTTSIDRDDVLIQAPWCVARPQEGSCLIYNPRTDELHLVPPAGYYLYELCDGLRSVGAIEAGLGLTPSPGTNASGSPVRAFLQSLLDRGILHVDDDHS